MLDNNIQDDSSMGELTGSFLDHFSGRAYPYVVRYRIAANDVQWTARIRLASVWRTVDAGPAASAVRPPFDRAETESDVRDAALSAMYGMDLPAALAAIGSARRRRLRRQCLCSALVVAALGAGAWLWETHSFIS